MNIPKLNIARNEMHKNLREIVSFILCLMFLLPPIYEHFDNHKYLKLGAQITLINSVKRKKS